MSLKLETSLKFVMKAELVNFMAIQDSECKLEKMLTWQDLNLHLWVTRIASREFLVHLRWNSLR